MALKQTTHNDLAERLDQADDRFQRGEERFAVVEKKVDQILEALKILPKMETDLAATKEVVEAWSTAKNFGRFLKWAAGMIAAMSAILVAIKVGATHLMR